MLKFDWISLLLSSSVGWFSLTEAVAYPYTIFRRDAFLDSSVYNEGLPQGNVGGQGHIIFQANNPPSNGYELPYSITFQSGQSPIEISYNTELPSTFDWINVDWNPVSNWIWVSFHTPTDDIVEDINSLVVRDAGGNLMQSFKEVDFAHSGMELFYVSQIIDENDDISIVIHFYCYYAGIDYEIDKLVLNGISLKAGFTVHGLDHYVVTYNSTQLSDAINNNHIHHDQNEQRKVSPELHKYSVNEVFDSGAPWTLNILLSDGLQFGWGGRFTLDSRRKLPIVAYPISSQCPFPNTNENNYNIVTDDLKATSLVLTENNTCSNSDYAVWSDFAQNNDNYDDNSVLVTVDVASDNLDSITSSNSGIDTEELVLSTTGIATGSLIAFDTTTSNSDFSASLLTAWQTQLYFRQKYPYLTGLITSASNSRVGLFAGMTDVTVAQFFLGGCHSTPMENTGSSFPATAVFDYVSNAAYNAMPQATYALINGPSRASNNVDQLNAATLTLSIGSAFAGGAQGVILENVDVGEESSNSDAWNAASALLNSYSVLDSQGLMKSPFGMGVNIVTSDNEGASVWGGIRSEGESVVITAVNTDCSGYDPTRCSSSFTPQWSCYAHLVESVNITLPYQFQFYYQHLVFYEMVNGKQTTIDFDSHLIESNTILQLSSVGLDAENTARIFYLGIQ